MTTPSQTLAPTPVNAPASGIPAPRRGRLPVFFIIAAVVLIAGLGFILFRKKGAVSNKEDAASRVVAVATADRGDLSQFTTLTAEFVPYQSVSVHAKVAGYVKSISVDIGDRVKAGQVLSVLEVPELNDDLKKASAELMTAREEVKHANANYEDVHLAYQRLTGVAKANPKLVAQQDVDTARSKDDAMASAMSAAQNRVAEGEANVGKMQTLLDYASITAPFDGVITKRYADTGALVQAGTASETQSMPVVDIAQDDVLRLIFPVPESAVARIHDGLPVEIAVSALKETFAGKVTRFSGKVDVTTRTMKTEIDVPNPDGKFTPGMYASVKVPLDQRKNVVIVPLQALSAGDNPSVMVLNKEGVLEERKVTVGLETSTSAEIASGLQEKEMVVMGGRGSLHEGEKATAKRVETGTYDEEGSKP